MPDPRQDESKQEFLNRCMADSEARSDFPDSDQRYAFCNSQWDSSVTNQLQNIRAHLDRPEGVRRTVHEGQEHLVVPVVMIVEGVLNGSLLTQKEFGKFVEAWNGRPVPVLHPEKHGEPVSANSPDIIEKNTIGHIFNAHVVDGKLKGEAWINSDKARRLGYNELLSDLEAGKVIEVSTGYFSEFKNLQGEFNGVPYQRIDVNIRPDHLALLPGQIGACSVADGCGTRTNKQQEGLLMATKAKTKSALETLAQALGFRANCNCEDGAGEMTAKERLQKHAEKLKANGKLTPEQIEMLMGMDPEQLAMVDALASSLTEVTESPEPEGMEDDFEEEPVMMAEKGKPKANSDQNQEKVRTFSEEDLDRIIANRMERNEVTRTIVANESNIFSEDELKAMSVDQLKKYAKSIRPADYSGQGGFASNSDVLETEGVEPLTINRGITARKQKEH